MTRGESFFGRIKSRLVSKDKPSEGEVGNLPEMLDLVEKAGALHAFRLSKNETDETSASVAFQEQFLTTVDAIKNKGIDKTIAERRLRDYLISEQMLTEGDLATGLRELQKE